jgi:hypothetical protein
VAETPAFRKNVGRFLREVIAPVAWCYALIKIAVFDIDSVALRAAVPDYLWVVDYKFFLLLGASVVLLLLLGPSEFLRLAAFILAYPFVLLFWKLPKRFYRQWPLILVFLPAIRGAAVRLWSTFLLYSLATFAALFILVSTNRPLLVVSIACLVPLLMVHLSRSLRKAYAASLFTQLVGLVGKLRSAIEAGTFVPWEQKATSTGSSGNPSGLAPTNPRQVAYSSHWLAQMIGERVKTVAKRRHYDLYLLASWFYTVVLTAVLFAFAHLGLHKAFPGAYADAEGAGFWSFLGLSLGILTTSNVSKISPVSAMANIASYAEVVCSLIILVILVFSILTAAREAFKENLDDFAAALGGVATALETRITAQWQVTIVELEVALLAESPSFVNSLRKLRGLPELPLPSPDASSGTEAIASDGGEAA